MKSRDGCHDVEALTEVVRHHIIIHPDDARVLGFRAAENLRIEIDRYDVRHHSTQFCREHPIARADVDR